MDQKHKNTIEEYRNLLAKNLIITEDFYRVLVTHGVFTEGLIKDIKKSPRGEQANQILDLLCTRTNNGYGKFCDALEVTGHHFLSDCLREADNVESVSELDLNDLQDKLPFIVKSVKNDQQKLALQHYFKDKIHREVVKQTWRGEILTKEKLMVARQNQIEQMWHFEEETKIKDKNMVQLQQDYMKLQEMAEDFRREIKSLHKHIEDMKKKHEEQLITQVKFNMANDRHLNRLNERAEDAGSYLLYIHSEVKNLLGESYVEKQTKTEYENLEENFKRMMSEMRTLIEVAEAFRADRLYVSNLVAGFPIEDSQSLKPFVQDYILKLDELKIHMDKKIDELKNINEQQRKEIEELSTRPVQMKQEVETERPEKAEKISKLELELESSITKIASRDERIKSLEKEAATLTSRIKQLEQELDDLQGKFKAKPVVNVSVPQARTPPKTPAQPSRYSAIRDQSPIVSHYKKPSATSSTSSFVLDKNFDSMSTLDAIKGQSIMSGDGVTARRSVEATGAYALPTKTGVSTNGGVRNVPSLAVTRNNRRM